MIPVNVPNLTVEDELAVTAALRSGWVSSEGPQVVEFENKLSERFDRQYSTVVSSGTAALELAFAAIELQPGDEVILPDFMIVSCLFPVLRANAVPVFIDCDPFTFNCNPMDILSATTEKTRAILIAHIYGLSVDIDPVLDYARQNGIIVIEDAAEVIGLDYKDRKCGSFGDISIFSFYPNKHITTGEGGALLTNDRTFKEKFDYYRNLGFSTERFIHKSLAWNYRMTSLQAALGISQLSRLDETVVTKREVGSIYNELLKGLESVNLPVRLNEFSENIFWVYPITLTGRFAGKSKEIQQKLIELGVVTRPFFFPLSEQPLMQNRPMKYFGNGNALKLYNSGFYLPSGLTLTYDEQKYVSASLAKALNQ